MELRGCGLRWFPVIRGLFGSAFGSAKRITLAHGPAKNRIGPGFGPTRSDLSRSDPLWVDFWSVWGPWFAKKCSPPSVGSTFLKNNFKHFRSDFALFCSPNGHKRSSFSHCICPSRLFWPFRSQFFRFLRPLEFCVWPMTCAFLASGARSAKTTACIIPTFLEIS